MSELKRMLQNCEKARGESLCRDALEGILVAHAYHLKRFNANPAEVKAAEEMLSKVNTTTPKALIWDL